MISQKLQPQKWNQGSDPDQSSIFPSNLYLEGCDQHSRWFLCSLVASVALAERAPFLALKTHGLVLDESGEKMSKSCPELAIDPEDLISGSEKLDGTRAFGFGTDVLRLWAASHDGDRNIKLKREELEQCNQQLKVLRELMRQMAGNLDGYDPNKQRIEFHQLSVVDKMMVLEILKFL